MTPGDLGFQIGNLREEDVAQEASTVTQRGSREEPPLRELRWQDLRRKHDDQSNQTRRQSSGKIDTNGSLQNAREITASSSKHEASVRTRCQKIWSGSSIRDPIVSVSLTRFRQASTTREYTSW